MGLDPEVQTESSHFVCCVWADTQDFGWNPASKKWHHGSFKIDVANESFHHCGHHNHM